MKGTINSLKGMTINDDLKAVRGQRIGF